MSAPAQGGKEPDAGRRLLLLGGVGLGISALVGSRLLRWQVIDSKDLAASASVQQRNEELVSATRGEIRSDDGSVLALTQPVYRLAATPDLIKPQRRPAVAAFLGSIVAAPPDQILDTIEEPNNSKYAVLAPVLEPEQSDAIRAVLKDPEVRRELAGIQLEPASRRVYPSGQLASHVVGFADSYGIGRAGVESYYDVELSGRPGRLISDRDPKGKPIPVGRYEPLPAEDGASLELTLDRAIQHIVEQELEQALARFGSTGGTIIVMDVRRGDILAMANRPAYDPGKLDEYSRSEFSSLNPAISLIFDPGSTFKIITMAAGLDAGVIAPYSTHNVPGVYKYWGLEFKNWDKKTYPNQTMVSVLANSSNVGAIYVADKLGADEFYRYVRDFGFGDITGVDLAGEVRGILKARGSQDWYPSDLAANSFGQSISVTPLQLAAAFGAVANGGVLMRPRVVNRIVGPSGRVTEREPEAVRRVIQESTALRLIEMMREAEHSIPTNLALSDRFPTIGKTGTAEIPDRGGILPEQTIASYVGFGPQDAPRLLVLVKIDRPQTGTWGSQVASPVFRKVIDRIACCSQLGRAV